MEKQNTQELRSVSDGQKNTLDKEQSKMIDAELVGLPEGKFKQKPETTIYSTIIQSQSSSSEKQEDQSQPLNNKGESLKKNKLDMDENTGWGTTERYSEKTQPNPQTNSHYKSFLNELIRKSAERKSVQNSANGLETDNILSSGNSQSVMINKSLYHLNGRAGIITNVTPETRHNIDKTTGSDTNIASPVSQTSYNINR
ncbi:hypothetical protein FQ488_07005 [Enterococcus hirae]|uniref:hypothetical protein n=1 Tax=Enterococcus hirae TaxID=1354 RepID=UPI0016280403|nr:hypothetical protein [Enterococcus hirae]QNG05462.1 hypothetical protein FQ488_07005 [Enterococcus hirae]